MARRDWGKLRKEFAALNKSDGMNLTQFCKLKKLNRSTAANQIGIGETKRTGKGEEREYKQHKKDSAKAKAKGQRVEKHILDEKIEFFCSKNQLRKEYGQLIGLYFELDTIKEIAGKMGKTPATIYSYLKIEEVQKTIEDITDTHYEVSTTTPARIKGRMCAIANSNMIDYYDDSGAMKMPNQWTRAQGLAVKEMKTKVGDGWVEHTLKLYDATDAIKILAKQNGAFDRPYDGGEEFKNLTDEELEDLINEQTEINEKLSNHVADPADD